MKSLDLWIVGFGLRCLGLLVAELAVFAFVVPTLFNLRSDVAVLGAALLAILALVGGFLATIALAREFSHLFSDTDHE